MVIYSRELVWQSSMRKFNATSDRVGVMKVRDDMAIYKISPTKYVRREEMNFQKAEWRKGIM